MTRLVPNSLPRPFAAPIGTTCLAVGLLTAILAALLVAPASAQTPTAPVGEDFQVNTVTTNRQVYPAVAMEPGGAFVVVWQSDDSTGSDTSPESLQAQRFTSDGTAFGSELQVNSYTTGVQRYGEVAMGAQGDFVVVWTSEGSDSTDTSAYSIRGKRFGSDGAPLATEFQVNSYTSGDQYYPQVGLDAEGGFVVIWVSDGSNGTDTDPNSYSIQAQRYAPDGSALGDQFQVNTYTPGNQQHPALAVRQDGAFVAAWKSPGSNGTDSDSSSIQAALFDSDGTPIGGEFQVNTGTTLGQQHPSVAMGQDGGFVVVWDSETSSDTDILGSSIQAQRYDSDGGPLGDEFQVNVYTTGDQDHPDVTVDPDGDFVVVWQSTGSSGTDTVGESIQIRRFASDGSAIGSQLQVNTYTSANQQEASVAVDQHGDVLVVWDSDGSSSTDTSLDSIQARRVRVTADVGDLVFRDEDADGLQDASEPGVEGIAVHLYDEGGSLLDSAVTDSEGAFLFRPKIALAGVTDRFYLAFEEPADAEFTAADVGDDDTLDSDADPFSGETGTITIVSAGEAELDWDAGLVPRAAIGDRVWLDDGDGLRVGGEPGVANVTVNLYAPDDTLVDTTNTDATGTYGFEAVAGDYYLEFVAPVGTIFAPRDQGSDDTVDSDAFASTGTTGVFTVTPGQLDDTRDAGLVEVPDPSAQVGNRVWLDANANGVQNGGEFGLAGVTVNLYREPDPPFFTAKASTLAGSVATDADGYYAFSVEPGTYFLEFVCSEDSFTALDQGASDELDSDVEPSTATTALFELADGDADGTRDAGLLDPDGDGAACSDNCPAVANTDQADDDLDGFGDVCDICSGFDDGVDTDDDTVPDGCDLCVGDDSTGDTDADGTCDDSDTCTDSDDDGAGDPGFPGDVCATDNCPDDPNADQADADSDGAGDVCDTCTDSDDDGFGDPGFDANTCATDNCPDDPNADQADADSDGAGDLCDTCTDSDDDGFGDPGFPTNDCATDNCPADPNADQADTDDDGAGDVCDLCIGDDATGDSDSDGVCDDIDACAGSDDGLDDDGDGVPDGCDVCQGDDASGDSDGDGICADLDCDDDDPTNACAFIFSDGFESGDTSGWSSVVAP